MMVLHVLGGVGGLLIVVLATYFLATGQDQEQAFWAAFRRDPHRLPSVPRGDSRTLLGWGLLMAGMALLIWGVVGATMVTIRVAPMTPIR